MTKDKKDTVSDEAWAKAMGEPLEDETPAKKKSGNGDYEVGYCRPPKRYQYPKDTSGNPRGKPKGSRNLKTDVKEVLSGRIEVNENGKKRKVSAQLATLMRLRERALRGEARALDRLLALAGEHNNDDLPKAKTPSTAEEDAAIIKHFLNRKAGKTDIPGEDSGIEEDKTSGSGDKETDDG